MFLILNITTFSVRNYLCNLLDSVIAVFLENSENDSKLKYWINFGIYWKIYFRILGLRLGSVALALHVSGLGLCLMALTPLALLTSLWFAHQGTNYCWRQKTSHWAITWRCLRDPTFSHFGTVPACDRRIDRRTHDDG